jgi:hypothetical protein
VGAACWLVGPLSSLALARGDRVALLAGRRNPMLLCLGPFGAPPAREVSHGLETMESAYDKLLNSPLVKNNLNRRER